MPLRASFRSATRLFAVFVVVTTTLAAALGWVSWRLIQQDRELERQRRQDRLGQVLDGAAANLLRVLNEREQQVVRLAITAGPDLRRAVDAAGRGLSDASALVVLDDRGIAAAPPGRVLYFPLLPSVPGSAAAPWKKQLEVRASALTEPCPYPGSVQPPLP